MNIVERAKVICDRLKKEPKDSDIIIGREIGVSPRTVAKYRYELEASRSIPKIEKRIGLDGKLRRAPKSSEGRSGNIIRDRMVKTRREAEDKRSEPTWEAEYSDDKIQVLSISDRICTEADAIAHGQIDLAVWYVHSQKIGSYECPMKLSQGHDENGKSNPDKPAIVRMWRVELILKRRVPQVIAEAAKLIIDRMVGHAPRYPKFPKLARVTNAHMLEISVFDTHFGKLAWAAETGQNYDLKIAESVYLDAVCSLLAQSQAHPIEKILFPLGQDFLHIDGFKGQTTAGTAVDYDCRYPKMFMAAYAACVNAIDYCAQYAPVHVPWVPGNHDGTASYHLCAMIWAHYQHKTVRNRVTVDISPKKRKFVTYGVCGLGFTHGDKEPLRDLVNIFQGEFRKELAEVHTFEIHHGHFHKARETVHVSVDTMIGGVRVRCLPSLSGTDSWHYENGYTGGMRAAEAYLWSKDRGYAAHLSANVLTKGIGK